MEVRSRWTQCGFAYAFFARIGDDACDDVDIVPVLPHVLMLIFDALSESDFGWWIAGIEFLSCSSLISENVSLFRVSTAQPNRSLAAFVSLGVFW